MQPNAYPALVLNANFRPLSQFPLSLMDWQTAVKNVYEGNLAVVHEYDAEVRSPSTTMKLPSVVAMRQYQPLPKRVAFTRFNVFLRDRFRCPYCGEKYIPKELTFDHVIPRAHGGVTCWENIVAACDLHVKKDSGLKMKPLRWPSSRPRAN